MYQLYQLLTLCNQCFSFELIHELKNFAVDTKALDANWHNTELKIRNGLTFPCLNPLKQQSSLPPSPPIFIPMFPNDVLDAKIVLLTLNGTTGILIVFLTFG